MGKEITYCSFVLMFFECFPLLVGGQLCLERRVLVLQAHAFGLQLFRMALCLFGLCLELTRMGLHLAVLSHEVEFIPLLLKRQQIQRRSLRGQRRA